MRKEILYLILLLSMAGLVLGITQPENQEFCLLGKCATCHIVNGCEKCVRSARIVDDNGIGKCVDGGIQNCWSYFDGDIFDGCEICEGNK